MPRVSRFPLFALSILVLAACSARTGRADIIELMDGTTQEGEVIHEDKNTITLSIQLGAMKGTVVLNRRDIRSVKVTDPVIDPALVEGNVLVKAAEALTDVKQAIAAWTKAAEFYDRHAGFSSEAHAAYEKVLLLDPDNAAIRAKLGYVQTPDGWAKKIDLQRAEAAKIAERARVVQAKAKVEDDMVIGLREDNALVKKIQEEKARAKADIPPAPPVAPQPLQPQPQFANQQYGGIEYYQGLPYYPTILYGFGPGGFGGNGFGFVGGGFNNGFGYSGYNNYGYGGGYGGGYGYSNYSSYYGGGLSLGFHGKIGSVRVSGRLGF